MGRGLGKPTLCKYWIQADGEMKEREKGVDYTPRRQRQGGITVSNSGSITVTPTYGRKCDDEDNSQAEEWAVKQEETVLL